MDNCYLGWFWDNETQTFKRWDDLIGKKKVKEEYEYWL
tara:strand:- start:435 stop:548 length:114 start_codon:yes stop_codon:yes gene_type:complete